MQHDSQHRQGLISIALAFWLWGVVVVYWKQLAQYDSAELILHRFIWSFLILLVAIWTRGDLRSFWNSFRNWQLVRLHLINGLLISVNWFSYVYAVNHDQILQGSLAYFMVPILNTAMGLIFLKERLNRLQWAAIILATLGVTNEIVQFGRIPWLALLMAFTFGFYGLSKTRSELGPVRALAMETGLLLPFALGALVFLHVTSRATADLTRAVPLLWMISVGFITVAPLLLFAYGAKRIQLTTIGVFQFLAPSITFSVGVWMYGEPFPASKMITFSLIWVALLIYLVHLFRKQRAPKAPLPQ